MDVDEQIDRLIAANERLAATLAGMPPEELSTATVLPGGPAHIITHLARHAEGCRNAFLAARSGQIVRRYVSPAARNADVDLGAARPPEMIVDDFLLRCGHLLIEMQSTPAELWNVEMVSPLYSDEGPPRPLVSVVQSRVSEIEIHHVDLGTRYRFNDSPPELVAALIERYVAMHTDAKMEPCTCLSSDTGASWSIGDGTGPTVRGTSGALLSWLTGRSGRTDVVADAGETLPTLPPS